MITTSTNQHYTTTTNTIMNTAIPITNANPHQTIEHVTIIHAPSETVWKDLVNVHDWSSWNHWTRLDIIIDSDDDDDDDDVDAKTKPSVGLPGKLRACYEGNDANWQTFDFEFAEVDAKHHVLAWKGAVAGGCLFSGYHTMRLEAHNDDGNNNNNNNTKLIHTEVF